MPIETNLNISPYFDDYDQDKDYYKILFRPGVSVQARELTQLQTILQNQIERFGDHIFKSGTIISGVNFNFNERYEYVKIDDVQVDSLPVDLPGYNGYSIRNSANLVAKIINYKTGFKSRDPDVNYLYLRYMNSGNDGTYSAFSNSEVLTIYSDANYIFGIDVNNGGTGFSNSDTVQIVSQILVEFTNGTIGAGNNISQTIETATANLNVLSVNSSFGSVTLTTVEANGDTSSVTYTDTNYKILSVKPIQTDLSNTSVTSTKWTTSVGYNVIQGASNTANVVAILGAGASAVLTTDSQGTINDISMVSSGSNYSFLPYVTVRSATGVLTNLDLLPRNYKSQVTVLDGTFNASGTTPTGNGYAFSVTDGIVYQKGQFLRVDSQTLIVNSYSSYVNDAIVAFTTDESIVNSSVDSTLLDNALGTPNEAAPGANRLKMVPTLVTLNVSSAAANNSLLPLVEFRDGFPFKQNKSTVYNTLAKEFERRTSESAGDYVLDTFITSTQDKQTANTDYAELIVDPGVAYISGKRIESERNTVLDIRRGTDTDVSNTKTISLNYGNFLYVKEMAGYFNTSTGANVNFYDTPRAYLSAYPSAYQGGIYGFNIRGSGEGYTNNQYVTLNDVYGTAAEAYLTTNNTGSITSIAISAPGSNYSSSANATVISGVTGIRVVDGGSNFTNTVPLRVTGGSLSGAATLTVSSATNFNIGDVIAQGNSSTTIASGTIINLVTATVSGGGVNKIVVANTTGTFRVTIGSGANDSLCNTANYIGTNTDITVVDDASAEIRITTDATGRIQPGVNILNPGIYSTPPTLTAVGPIKSINITSGGTGYSNSFPVAIVDDPNTQTINAVAYSTSNSAFLKLSNVASGIIATGANTGAVIVTAGNGYVSSTRTAFKTVPTFELTKVDVAAGKQLNYSNSGTGAAQGGVVYFTGNNLSNSMYVTLNVSHTVATALGVSVSQGNSRAYVAKGDAAGNTYLLVNCTGPFNANATAFAWANGNTATVTLISNSHANAILTTTATGEVNGITFTPTWRTGHYIGVPKVEIGSRISGVTVTSGGVGYQVGESITVSPQDGKGYGAACNVASVDFNGGITGVAFSNNGIGYTKPPTLTPVSAGGKNAILKALVGQFNTAADAVIGFKAIGGVSGIADVGVPISANLVALPNGANIAPLIGVTLDQDPGTQIGTGKIRSLVHHEGVPGTPEALYRMYLYDIKMNPAKSTSLIKNVTYPGTPKGTADPIQELIPSTGATGTIFYNPSQSKLVFRTGSKALKSGSNATLTYKKVDTSAVIGTNGALQVSVSGADTIKYGPSVELSPSQRDDLIIVPTSNTTATTGYAVYCQLGSDNVFATGINTYFDIGDHVEIRTFNTSGGEDIHYAKVANRLSSGNIILNRVWPYNSADGAIMRLHYPKYHPISLKNLYANTTSGGQTLNVRLIGNTAGNTFTLQSQSNAIVTFDVKRSQAQATTKTINRNVYVKLSLANNAAGATGPWCIGLPDVFRLNGVYLGSNSSVSTSDPDVSQYFFVTSGQKDDYYDFAYLHKKNFADVSLGSAWLLLNLDVFTTSGTGRFYNVDSYVTSNTGNRATLGNTAINPLEIPDYTDNKGDFYILSDVIDFRPHATATATITGSVASASVNPSNTVAFGITDKLFPVPDSDYVFSATRYLPRLDRIVIDSSGAIKNIEGTPQREGSLIPPPQPSDTMTVATVIVPPFPSVARIPSNTNLGFMSRGVYTDKPTVKRIRDFQFTVDSENTVAQFFQPKRYTMKDIGQLERRIEQIEFYTSLNQLEAKTKDLFIPSSVDPYLNRHKNGFYVEQFNGYEGADTSNPEFFIHIDDLAGVADPEDATYNFQMRFDYVDPNVQADIIKPREVSPSSNVSINANEKSHNLYEPGQVSNQEATLMLPFSEVAIIRQEKFTSAITGAGYNAVYSGDMFVEPSEFRVQATLEVINTPDPPPPPPPSGGGGGGGGGCKIICTKLYELGLLEEDIFAADQQFGELLREKYPNTYYGYLAWAHCSRLDGRQRLRSTLYLLVRSGNS